MQNSKKFLETWLRGKCLCVFVFSSCMIDWCFSDLKGEQKEAIENFQTRLTKVEHSYTQSQDLGYIQQKEEPNTQYEQLRRRIATNTQEFWYFIRSEVVKMQKRANEVAPELMAGLNNILSLGVEHKR